MGKTGQMFGKKKKIYTCRQMYRILSGYLTVQYLQSFYPDSFKKKLYTTFSVFYVHDPRTNIPAVGFSTVCATCMETLVHCSTLLEILVHLLTNHSPRFGVVSTFYSSVASDTLDCCSSTKKTPFYILVHMILVYQLTKLHMHDQLVAL